MAREDASSLHSGSVWGDDDADPIFPAPAVPATPVVAPPKARAAASAPAQSSRPKPPPAEPKVETKAEPPPAPPAPPVTPVVSVPSVSPPVIPIPVDTEPGDIATGAPRGQLPAELLAIPLWADHAAAPVRICVVVRKSPDAIEGSLLLRRDLLDAKVYLGCLVDAFGVMEMLEIWVQSVDGSSAAYRAHPLAGEVINNAAHDDRWKALSAAAMQSWPGAVIATGFETQNPPPTFLDAKKGIAVHPAGWELCRNEALLKAADLPAYATSLHRYLTQKETPKEPGDRKFIPVTPDAPTKDGVTADYSSILPSLADLIPINPGGGLIQIRPAGNLRLGELTDIIAGKKYEGSAYGKSRYRFSSLKSLLSSASGHLFSPTSTHSATRLVESLFLRLRLLTDMVEEVAKFTAVNDRPLLNLTPASFAVKLDEAPASLPALWTTRVMLTDPGDAIPLKFPQGDTAYNFCVPGKSVRTSFYQRDLVARGAVAGFGALFISAKLPGPIIEGTLTFSDPIRPTVRDVIRIRVPLQNRRVDFFVRIELGGPSPSVLKFRSVPDDRLKPFDAELKALVGVPLHEVSFEHYPLFSSAADVYSLCALAVELLLTRPEGNPAEQFRHLMALATRVRETHGPDKLEARIQAIFSERPDWLRWLGPQCLSVPVMDADAAMRCVTPQLWFSTLALLVQMLTQYGLDSYLRDFGDMIRGRMDGVYQVMLQELRGLLIRSRSLMFGEWGTNRQIASVLHELSAEQGDH